MITIHEKKAFNPNKYNYTHVVHFTDGNTIFLIVNDAKLCDNVKTLAEMLQPRFDAPINILHEILPDGEIVQELNITAGTHERFISGLSAYHKRRAQAPLVQMTAAII